MKTTAVRLHGENDLRLDQFELPEINDGQILARVVSDSLCMSSYKAAKQGPQHKRVPNDVAAKPIIIGHEFCGEIIRVGAHWQQQFSVGSKFSIQPALNYAQAPVGILSAPGYSYEYIGGDATYVIIPEEVMLQGCLLQYDGDGFFPASLSEPMSCIVGAFHANYHTTPGSYEHRMGIVEGGNTAILAGVGPMGLGAIDYALHCDRRPALLVVTDIDDARLQRAQALYSVEEAQRCGVKLVYLNTTSVANPVEEMLALSNGAGFDDVFVFAPVKPVLEQADAILGKDGCLNFFAGPTDPKFSASFNFYNVHYASTHVVGTSGGNTDDMVESLTMMAAGKINPAVMITHIGGLDAVVDTTLNLPKIPGGKKLVYNHISLPLTAIDDFATLGKQQPLFAALAEITQRHQGLWSIEAETYLLQHGKQLG